MAVLMAQAHKLTTKRNQTITKRVAGAFFKYALPHINHSHAKPPITHTNTRADSYGVLVGE